MDQAYLMGEAEGLGQLADLTQGAQVLVQAIDHLLDALPVVRLGGTCSAVGASVASRGGFGKGAQRN